MIYDVEIETRVRGLPCIIGVTYYMKVRPNPYATNDWEYNGYTERGYDILDRRGYKAKWLEDTMTQKDFDHVDQVIDEYYESNEKDEYTFPEGL